MFHVVVDSWFHLTPIVCGDSVFGLFVMHYLVFFLVLESSCLARMRRLVALLNCLVFEILNVLITIDRISKYG